MSGGSRKGLHLWGIWRKSFSTKVLFKNISKITYKDIRWDRLKVDWKNLSSS